MTLAPLLDALTARPGGEPALARVQDAVTASGNAGSASVGISPVDLSGPPGLRPFAVAALARSGRTILAVTATDREADDLTEALSSLLDPRSVALYPSWETLPHERLSPGADTVGRRLAVLRRLAHPEILAASGPADAAASPLSVVVAPVRAVLQPQVKDLGQLEPVLLRSGDSADLADVVERLVGIAYHRVDLVERRGQIAVRGGILDVFPPTEEHPLRVEFFGDEIEDIRPFAVADQRALDVPASGGGYALFAPPCRELLLTPEVRARAARLAREHPDLVDMLDKIASGIPVEGMEALAPVLVDDLALLLDELPAGTQVLLCDPERVRSRASELVRTSQEFLNASWSSAALGSQTPIDLGSAAYRTLADVRSRAAELGLPWWTVSQFGVVAGADGTDSADEPVAFDVPDEAVVTSLRPPPAYHGDTARLLADVKGWLNDSWRVLLVTAGHGPAQRLVELLREADLGARLTDDAELAPSVVTVTQGQLVTGFTSDLLRLAVLTETDLAGARGVTTKDMRRMPSRRRKGIDPLALAVGDLVVHEAHGVGRYIEMVTRTVAGAKREYLVLEYAKGDRLYVPTDALEQVTRYVGGEAPTLDRIGGADWAKRKSRARKAVKEIAGELIRLYSARMAAPGYAFGPDNPWQRELEDAFPFRETPDQLSAIDEVKRDMERAVPMDRVICGDVGYGKTEIAVRAAFKAVQDGKQVAVLVPTTLLVQQHFQTFSERYAAFPVIVKAMSRFNTATEQKAVLAGLADGTVDVVIGTHRLLSNETRFKDLGLVIVDEEQRFGVEHKEHLKKMRTAVDVLTMSATPIPRTLEMSITGIRELSTIDTPPEERHPVLTSVSPYDQRQVAAAIRRELLREGQVFFIHNRVESIDRAAARLRELVPEARIATAHGQLSEDVLEKVMVSFWERKFDVLVCTTIVESGLDISNANTLIVERADNFGLSQLHQLRGRVGRGRERAYAYFLYPPDRPLTETAHDRLATIALNTDLGAGMAVAMKDLEIRGAGNLLGGEQSGHIAAIGFDLYVRMVGEAVADFKGAAPEELPEVKVELPVDASLPHDYVGAERLRLDAYRRLAAASSEEDLAEVRAELVDRFGPLPEVVENLFAVASLRVLARGYGLSEITLAGKQIRFAQLELRESQTLRLQRLYKGALTKPAAKTVLVPVPTQTGRIGSPALRDKPLLAWAADLLSAILGDSISAAANAAATNRP
ncbi:transcription-repair coupling factor [Pseudofrankia inefficax]|uniref:Transcription-repair-coupling factor n=1 Tax=Pseudofrankia inefficax (strain DSM 45817 / CECT 9037 / DDB 130130 / EuI1c) TaxID=298654 RepID=E3JCM7_PSEI1|nr:transcription-repair coupling factor [Pseudofrankia inefficax]ADP78723.1 transcription-repair coupling factor [Pseudofrankia inefficax]